MPALKTRLDAKIAELKAALPPEHITLVLDMIALFIEADRRGALASREAPDAPLKETV